MRRSASRMQGENARDGGSMCNLVCVCWRCPPCCLLGVFSSLCCCSFVAAGFCSFVVSARSLCVQVCEDAFGHGNDDHARFWHAVALTAEGEATEAIRELDPLQNVPDMALAVNAALINAHRTAKGKGQHARPPARGMHCSEDEHACMQQQWWWIDCAVCVLIDGSIRPCVVMMRTGCVQIRSRSRS